MMPDRGDFIIEALNDYEKPLLGYVRRLLGGDPQASDVVQDAFLQLCRGKHRPARSKLRAWLFAVCRNRAFDILRKEKDMCPLQSPAMEDTLADPRPIPQQSMETAERAASVKARIAALPANQREVIHLKFREGLSYRQISEITGHSVSNVGFLIHTAVTQLRRELDPNATQGGTDEYL